MRFLGILWVLPLDAASGARDPPGPYSHRSQDPEQGGDCVRCAVLRNC